MILNEEKEAMEAPEVIEIIETLLNAMEVELERERLSLTLCDAWQDAEHLLVELDSNLEG